MQFVDRELARRLEASEAIPQVHFATELKKINSELQPAHMEVAGSHCVFIHPGCVVGRCTGLGLSGPVTEADLDRIEEFYRSRGEAAQIDVVPTADPSLLKLMKERPYRLEELNNVLVRRLKPDDVFDDNKAQAEIREVDRAQVPELCEVVSRGFSEGKDPDPVLVEIFRPLYLAEGCMRLGAFVDGELVGGAGGMIISEAGIIALFGSAMLPAYRKRGIQTAFLQRRLKIGAEAGCEYAVIVTQGGSASERNAQRAGLTLAYSKPVMKRSFDV